MQEEASPSIDDRIAGLQIAISDLQTELAHFRRETRNRSNHNKKILLGSIGLLVLSYVVGKSISPAAWSGSTITATQFVLRDQDGMKRACLEMDQGGHPRLAFFDRHGKHSVELAGVEGDETGGITFFGPNGIMRFGIGIRNDGSSGLTVYDSQERVCIRLGKWPKEQARLVIADPDSIGWAGLGADRAGNVGLFISDNQGKNRILEALYPGGSSGLTVLDKSEQPRYRLTVTDSGQAELFVDK